MTAIGKDAGDVRRIGFDPAALDHETIDAIIQAIRDVKAGKRVETGFGSPYSLATHFGFLKEEAVNRPCPTCGTSRVDYRYSKITPAGRAILAFADQKAHSESAQ